MVVDHIPFFRHDLGEDEFESIKAVLQGPILTTGSTVAQFERRFADGLGIEHCVALSSCTAALHLALTALGIGPGDEVITTPMTFIATATAIIQAGATPVFVDVEADTGNMDASNIAAAVTEKTRAIMPVHLFGLMVDMRSVRAVADRYGLAVIEDCAHCIEGSRDGVRPGQLSDAACFSFYATKNMTCGEGGALVCRSEALAHSVRLLRLHGMNKTAHERHTQGYSHWDMPVFGWKYNMDNIHAALLLPQLSRLERNLKQREKRAERYHQYMTEVSGVSLLSSRPSSVHARHLFPIRCQRVPRDEVIVALKKRNIESVVNYRAIHLLTYFKDRFGYGRGAYPHAERLGDELLSLPFYPTMPFEHIDAVNKALFEIVEAEVVDV